MNNSFFVVSIDFELFWGVADIDDYRKWDRKISEVYKVVPRTLALFKKYGIRATWATVGGIMLDDADDLLRYLPEDLPSQTKQIIDKFRFQDESARIPDYMLFARNLVSQISATPGQELGTHTFTHYYCDKKKSNPIEFRNEIETCIRVMDEKRIGSCRSIVFPRNQVSDSFLSVLPENIICYRGKIKGFIDEIKRKRPKLGTLIWYLDHYIPLQNSTYSEDEIRQGERYNVRLSRLFKAYNKKYSALERKKVYRYKKEMTYAAKHDRVYHICWHPHNFSDNSEKNFKQLEELLLHYRELNDKYGMKSMNMGDFIR